jgi:hypothetical protein
LLRSPVSNNCKTPQRAVVELAKVISQQQLQNYHHNRSMITQLLIKKNNKKIGGGREMDE